MSASLCRPATWRNVLPGLACVCALLAAKPPCAAAAEEPWLTLTPLPGAAWEALPQGDLRSTLAPRAAAAPTIDGRLDDHAWRDATEVTPWSEVFNLPPTAARWASVRVTWTEQALFFAVKATKPGESLRAEVREAGGRVWTDDALEFFLTDPANGIRYQIDVNALATVWTGTNRPTLNWAPAVRAAAQIETDHWTLELAVPWTSLGITEPGTTPLRWAVRYLVNQQTGWVATAGSDGAHPTLAFAPEQQAEHAVRVRSVLLPRTLPAGKQAVAVEVENPGPAPRRAIARIVDVRAGKIQTQQMVEVPAGATQRLSLELDVPATGYLERTLMAGDPATRSWRFSRAFRVSALPAVALELDRERLWAGDSACEGTLTLGLPEAELAQGLEVQWWDELQPLARAALAAPLARSYDLRMRTDDLKPGQYRLVLRRGERTLLVREVAIQQAAALPARQRVALRVDWPEGARVAGDAPLYAGLSLPGGMLADEQRVRIVDEAGREVPRQTEVLARWGPGGSIQWLGLHFQGRPGRSYFAELGHKVQAATPARGVRVEEGPDLLLVDTGAARFELPRSGPLLGRAWLGNRQVLAGGQPALLLADQHGAVADETRGGGEPPVVELAGPLCTVIRREGLYRTANGRRLGKYTVRLSFFANSPHVKVQHSFIVTEDTNKVQFSDIALRVRPAFDGPWEVMLDDHPAFNASTFAATIDPAKDEAAYLLQSVYPHHHQSDSRFEIGVKQAGQWSVQAEGAEAGPWAAVRGKGAGVALTVRHLAQSFPKELHAGPEGLTAHLWSSRGGRHLDYRPAELIDYWDREWIEKGYPGGAAAMAAVNAQAFGTARTHDLWLHLLADDTDVPAAAHLAQHPPLALQDPAWLRQSEALGPVSVPDPQRFPRHEAFLRNFFTHALAEQARRWGDYGFLDFGAGPHWYDHVLHPPGQTKPKLNYRYAHNEYNLRTTLWLLYARSGERAYFDYADAFNRHLADFRHCYFESPRRPLGAMLGGSGSTDNPYFWAGMAYPEPTGIIAGHQGVDLDNFLWQFYLTGDRRLLDPVNLMHDLFVQRYDPTPLPNVGSVSSTNLFQGIAAILYRHRWDRRLATLLAETRRRILDPETSTGLVDQDYYGAWYKVETRAWGAVKDYEVTGAARARQVVEKVGAHLLTTAPSDGPGYQDHGGWIAWHAHRLSGDERYPRWLAERLGRVAFRFTDESGVLRGAPYHGGSHTCNIMETFIYGMDMVARAGTSLARWPMADTGPGDEPVAMYVVKEPRQALRLDLRARRDLDVTLIQPQRDEHRKRRGVSIGPAQIEARPAYFSQDQEGLGGGWTRLVLPAEALPGQYRITGAGLMLDSDTRQLVLAAPRGLHLRAISVEPRSWHFLVPAGARGAIYASRPVRLESGAQRIELPGGTWHELAGSGEDPMWALHAQGQVFVRFRGDIPAVLAPDEPARFFLPADQVLPEPLEEPASPNELFAAGVSGKPGDQALSLSGSRSLSIPRGAGNDAAGVFEHIDYQRGTLEFWLKPRWTSGLVPDKADKYFIHPGGFWTLYYSTDPDNTDGRFFNRFHFIAQAAEGSPTSHILVNPTNVDQSHWHHIAICWDTLPERGWVSELYVNGKPSSSWNRPLVGLSRFGENEGGGKAWKIAIPQQDHIRLLGSIDALIDELRISDVPRYPRPFSAPPPERRQLDADEHTLLLMRFDGDVKAITPRQQGVVEATLSR